MNPPPASAPGAKDQTLRHRSLYEVPRAKQRQSVSLVRADERLTPRGLAEFAEAGEAARAAQAAHFARFAGAAAGTLADQADQAARAARAAQGALVSQAKAPPLLAVAPPPVRPRRVPRVTLGTHDPRLVLLIEPSSPRAEAFRTLRDNLLEKGLPRVVAVSSVAPRAGATTCAMNVALALAESQTQILLLEGNTLAPSLAGIFEVDEAAPSLDVHLPRVAPYELVEVTPNLHVAVTLHPSSLRFDKRAFMALLDHLCGFGYDHIIVDSPPLGTAPNPRPLLAAVDAVLLAVRGGTTTRALRRAVDAIPKGKALGIALVEA